MKARNFLPKTLLLAALSAAAWALVAASGSAPARAQIDPGYQTVSVPFGALTLAAGQSLVINVAHNDSAGREIPTSLAFEVSARAGTVRGGDGAVVTQYHPPQRLTRDLTLAPGRSLSFEYTNSTAAAVHVRAAAQLAGIDTSPTSAAQGIDTSPGFVTLELREAGKTVAVMGPVLRR